MPPSGLDHHLACQANSSQQSWMFQPLLGCSGLGLPPTYPVKREVKHQKRGKRWESHRVCLYLSVWLILTVANDSAHRMGAETWDSWTRLHIKHGICANILNVFSGSFTVWRLLPPCGQTAPLQGAEGSLSQSPCSKTYLVSSSTEVSDGWN